MRAIKEASDSYEVLRFAYQAPSLMAVQVKKEEWLLMVTRSHPITCTCALATTASS